MKNNITKISVVSLVCAMCAGGAFGAASVRTLGGAGTYSGTTAAATAATGSTSTRSGSDAINAVRGGSMRVTSGSGQSGTSTTVKAGGTATRAASQPRVSMGGYLSGLKSTSTSTSSSGASSSRPGTTGGTTTDPSAMADLEARVGVLESDVGNLQDASDNFVRHDDLRGDVAAVVFDTDGVSVLENDAGYITDADLGDYVQFTDMDEALADYVTGDEFDETLADYVTSSDLDAKLDEIDGQTGESLSDLQQKVEAAQAAAEAAQGTADTGVAAAQAANKAAEDAQASADKALKDLEELTGGDEGGALGGLAFKSAVDTTEITDNAVTSDKLASDIQTTLTNVEVLQTLKNGSVYILTADAEGNLAVSDVEIIGGDGEPIKF